MTELCAAHHSLRSAWQKLARLEVSQQALPLGDGKLVLRECDPKEHAADESAKQSAVKKPKTRDAA